MTDKLKGESILDTNMNGKELTCCRCGDDARSLQQFIEAQRMAFHKILKKYKV